MLDIRIDASQLDRVALDFVATEKQAERALRSTLGKMAKWVKTRSVRGLASELKIPQRVVRRRVKTLKARKTAGGSQIAIWYGQNPAAMIYLNARQNSTGVTAGAYTRNGAFIAKGKGGGKQVFKRAGKARLPLVKQEVEIKPQSDDYLESNFIDSAAFTAQFYKVFEHEMQWQTRT
jgi:alanyl-tRNA synthetase